MLGYTKFVFGQPRNQKNTLKMLPCLNQHCQSLMTEGSWDETRSTACLIEKTGTPPA